MNKFRRILGKIAAETGLKMDYFDSKALRAPPPDPLASGD